jgi:hypothetical protein
LATPVDDDTGDARACLQFEVEDTLLRLPDLDAASSVVRAAPLITTVLPLPGACGGVMA